MKITKRALTFFLSAMLTMSAWAVPAYRGWQERTLTDGTPITIRQIGDEFYHFWETKDGKIALEKADGTFVVTDKPLPTKEHIQQRRMASKMYQSRKQRKAIGERNFAPKGLVILVQFSGSGGSFQSENNAAAFNNMLNQEGYSYGGATGSAVDYFRAQSNGQYVPSFDVFGPVTLPNNLAYYGEQDFGDDGIYDTDDDGESDLYIADFVIDAILAADAAGCDFSQYDSDNDGYVDIVYFFYAGKGQAAGGTPETIWPHNWELQWALYSKLTHGTSGYYYNDTYPYSKNLPRLDGKYINNYVCSAELKSDGSRSGIGTLCHEFSHVLGMPDYYDTDGSTNGKNLCTPQEWSIMDYGSYNNNEMTPPNYSIFDKYFMGWATPKFLAKDADANITMTTGYDDAYQITGGTTGPVAYTNSGTVYYIENRQKTGWDAYLPGSGMLVWQVKYNSTAWTNNAPNNSASNTRYTIVPADGKTSNYGYASDAFPRTNVTSYTPYTGCKLSEITKSGSNITFKYNNGASSTEWAYTLYGDHCSYPADGTVLKNTALNLTITPATGYTLSDESCWEVIMGGSALTYGSGFTYNPGTGDFSIASVTGDVEILVEGKRTVTWNVAGVTSTALFSEGAALVVPSPQPSDCSGEGGKKFVGWTANSTVSGSAPSDLFTSAGTKTVTADITYYAVYATAGTGGGGSSEVASVTFSNASSDGTADKSNSISDLVSSASGISSYSGSKVYAGTTGIKLGSGSATGAVTITLVSAANVKTVKVTAKKYGSDTGTLSVKAGDTSIGTAQTPPASAGELTFTTESAVANAATITVATSSKRAYISSITVIADGGGTSYSNYSLICGVPCSNTPSMSFSPETEGKTTADVSFTKAVSVSGTGSSQIVTYDSSDKTVATVDNSGVVTLKGKIGSTTITASVLADGDYCAASASYTLNVTAAPINVTLYYNGTSATLTNQTSPYTLPTTGAYVANMCDDDWTFAGWYSSAYTKSETAPTYITQLNATGSAYAVYTTTETSGDSGSSEVASVTFSNASSDGSADKSSSISDLVSSASGISSYSGSKVYAGTTGIKLGSGSATGAVTITLASAANVKTVKVTAKKYGSDTGTLSVKAGDTSIGTAQTPPASAGELTFTTESAVANAATITVATSSKRAYIASITVIADGGGTTTTYYATSPDCAGPPVPTYTVLWKACGETFKSETYSEGDPLVLPDPAPEDNAGKSFCGWTTSEHYTGAEAPTLISAGSAVNADATYYAVFH